MLADHSALTYKYLDDYLYQFLDAKITQQTSPEEVRLGLHAGTVRDAPHRGCMQGLSRMHHTEAACTEYLVLCVRRLSVSWRRWPADMQTSCAV